MTIKRLNHIIGPLQNNCFLILDDETNEAVIIDPPLEVETIFPKLQQSGIEITRILITHAHFDHIGGVQAVLDHCALQPKIYMHAKELPLWQDHGSADEFNIQITLPNKPDVLLEGELELNFGNIKLQTLFTPGHTPGHCTFYSHDLNAAFCGDVIFYRSIGRTDFPGGDLPTLLESIRKKIFTLPQATELYPGHGRHTTVQDEMDFNPFLG
jgi:glyoxylase-like metal-dependent hydrolase (beta-lactamase superfamily II)